MAEEHGGGGGSSIGGGLFFLGIIVFFFLIWLAGGGPSRPISFSGPYITPIRTVGDTQSGYGNTGVPRNSADSDRTSGWSFSRMVANLERDKQEARLFGTPSPYKDKVSLGRGNVKADSPREESLSIGVSSRIDAPVSISGWRLVSVRTGASATIPFGTSAFQAGAVNGVGPIQLSGGDKAIVVTGDSPIGTSFKENLCTGYLSSFQEFTPKLSERCPSARDDFKRFYNGSESEYYECEEFVRTISRCEVPSATRAIPSSCRAFRDYYLSYNGCVAAHASDKGFNEGSWRIYLDAGEDLWRDDGDSIKLLDSQGYTVDLLVY